MDTLDITYEDYYSLRGKLKEVFVTLTQEDKIFEFQTDTFTSHQILQMFNQLRDNPQEFDSVGREAMVGVLVGYLAETTSITPEEMEYIIPIF